MGTNEQLTMVKRIKAIAETGLVYAENGYDRERYVELRTIALQMMADLAGQPFERLQQFFLPQEDYPTVKVDVRGFVLNDNNELLMARESVDGKWTIPGGWADIGDSPSEAVIKEIFEETGLKATVERLLAVYDKRCHPHPPQPFYIYKLMFYCKVDEGTLKPGFDMQQAGWFPLDYLPVLSEDRILESQLRHLFQLVSETKATTYFD